MMLANDDFYVLNVCPNLDVTEKNTEKTRAMPFRYRARGIGMRSTSLADDHAIARLTTPAIASA